MNKMTKSLNKKNNELDKLLTKENDTVMTDIVCYIRVANISAYYQEIIRHDLLEMVISAQDRGENIKEVIGEDYKLFCDEVICNVPQKSKKEKVIEFIDTVLLCSCIIGLITIILSTEAITLVTNIFTTKPLQYDISINIGSLISYVLTIVFAFLIVNFIGKTSLRSETKPIVSKKKKFLIAWFIGVGISVVLLIIAWFGKQTVFTVNIAIALVVLALLYILHKVIQGKAIY